MLWYVLLSSWGGLTRGRIVEALRRAAAVVAVALTPILFAYLQLGYHPDVGADAPEVTGEDAAAFLDRSVHNATAATAGNHAWTEREQMADAVREYIDRDVETLETARLEAGVVSEVDYNATAAERWAGENCEGGPGRRFGECDTDGGVVLQERAGEAVVLAVAFDVRVVGPEGESELTVLNEVGG